MEDNKFDIYKLVFNHSDREITTLWQRNNSFLVANSALIIMAGILKGQLFFSFALSILGFCLAIVWFFTNRYSHAWSQYWICELKRLEKEIGTCDIWTRAGSLEARKSGRPSVKFHNFGVYIAGIFVILWFLIGIYFGLSYFKIV